MLRTLTKIWTIEVLHKFFCSFARSFRIIQVRIGLLLKDFWVGPLIVSVQILLFSSCFPTRIFAKNNFRSLVSVSELLRGIASECDFHWTKFLIVLISWSTHYEMIKSTDPIRQCVLFFWWCSHFIDLDDRNHDDHFVENDVP